MDNLSFTLESVGINLPYNMEAEQAVLGAALLSSDCVPLLVEKLRPEHFYSRQNGEVFTELVRLFTGGAAIDFVTVLGAVVDAGVFSSQEEAKVYLTGIAETVPSISNIP
ncbi:MAG: DnaB-like helicase N-terminal domain-containing protein, partial [Ruthenibacterium sp.]